LRAVHGEQPSNRKKEMNEIMQNMDVNFSVDAEVDDIGSGGYWVCIGV
jgi:hypothetical protein